MKIPGKGKKKLQKNNLKFIGLIVFALVGTILIFRTFASVPNQSIQAESATLTEGATKVSDSAASGGEYVAFGGTVSPPPVDDGLYGLPALSVPSNAVYVNNGSELSVALDSAGPGTFIVLRSGSYGPIDVDGKNGTSDNWIRIVGDPSAGSRITTGRMNVNNSSYIEIRRLKMVDNRSGAPFSKAFQGIGVHHLRIYDNELTEGAEAGISFPGEAGASHIDIRFNDIHNNAKWGNECCQGSGISIFLPQNIGGAPDSDGYSMWIIGNRIWDNQIGDISLGGWGVTDGNCIIFDLWENTGYSGRGLVYNNVCVDNGGPGMAITHSDQVDVFNNTFYMNNRDNRYSVDNNGEIMCFGTDIRVERNIVVARDDNPNLWQPFDCSNYSFKDNVWVKTGYSALGSGDLVLPSGTQVFSAPNLNASQGDWTPVGQAVGRGAKWPQ